MPNLAVHSCQPHHKLLRWIVVLFLLTSPALLPAGKENLEYQVKAAFLLNFTRFIEWPATEAADPQFSICVLGHDPFGHILDRMVEGESVAAHKMVVRRVTRDQTQACQILFVERSEKEIPKLLTGLSRGVLTVGEGDDFLRDGGMIAFVIENRRVRFDINITAASAASLRISSKLLNVARTVEK